MLEISQLSRRFGSTIAVEDVSLEAYPGEILGLLGPNGAGKSTTMACASGLLVPDGGRVRVFGLDPHTQPREARRRLGLVPQDLAIYENLSVAQNLEFFAALFMGPGAARSEAIRRALAMAQLGDRVERPVKTLSGGMKRRLNLVISLLHKPDVVLCDEPTVGVDPQSRQHLFQCIRELRGSGKAVVYSTHYMEEVEALCDRVAIIDRGRVVASGTLSALLREHGPDSRLVLELHPAPRSEVAVGWSEAWKASALEIKGAALHVRFGGTPNYGLIFQQLEREGFSVVTLTQRKATLEDVFLKLTGHALRDES